MGHWGVMIKVPCGVVELCSESMWEDYICARPQANRYIRTLGCSSSQRVSETASIPTVPEEWPFRRPPGEKGNVQWKTVGIEAKLMEMFLFRLPG